MDYGKRNCLECGKEFAPQHAAELCCSEECRKGRKRKLDAVRSHTITQLRADFNALYVTILSMDERLKRLEAAKVSPVDEVKPEEKQSLSAPAEDPTPEDEDPDYLPGDELLPKDDGRPKLTEFCKRMNVKATSLPCGKNPKCFEPTRCKRVPKDVKGFKAPLRGGRNFIDADI